jgi:hypothetical protein
MSVGMDSIKKLVFICILVLFGSCGKRGDSNKAAVDSVALKSRLTDDKLNGTFEYTQPADQAFVHITIETKKRGDSLDGRFLGGIYLKKSEEGEYSEPSILTECKIVGFVRKGKVAEMKMKVTKVDRLKKNAPNFLEMMNLSTEITTVWIFTLDNGTLVSQNGTVENGVPVKYVWKRVK